MTPTLCLWYNINTEREREKGNPMKCIDEITVIGIIEATCEKNGFQWWELDDNRYLVWLSSRDEPVAVTANDDRTVTIENRFNETEIAFEDLNYPVDPELGMAIYRRFDSPQDGSY